jgi:hypothetical protein
MKTSLPLLIVAFLLSGCAGIFKAPPGAAAPGPPFSRDSYDRTSWIEARSDQLENKGLSKTEARAQATTEVALHGR